MGLALSPTDQGQSHSERRIIFAPGAYCGGGGGVARSRKSWAKASVSARELIEGTSPGRVAARALAALTKASGLNRVAGLASAWVSSTRLSFKALATALRQDSGERTSFGAVGISAKVGKGVRATEAALTSAATGDPVSTGWVAKGLTCTQAGADPSKPAQSDRRQIDFSRKGLAQGIKKPDVQYTVSLRSYAIIAKNESPPTR
jgi:hypothetical protein